MTATENLIPKPPERGGYIPTLDGWRAIAICLVLLSHARFSIAMQGWCGPQSAPFQIAGTGIRGVDVFFGISGLLITSRLLAEHQKHGRISLKNFYIRRAFRIFPLYLAYLLTLAVALGWGLPLAVPRELLSCVLFFRNYFLPGGPGRGLYTEHFWSLCVEEHFYMIWPGLLVLCGIMRGARLAAGLAIAVIVWRTVDVRLHLIPLSPQLISFRSDYRLDGLLLGCLGAFLLNDEVWRARVRKFLAPPLLIAMIVFLFVCIFWSLPLQGLMRAWLIPLILLGTIQRADSLTFRWLEWRPIQWFGRISYSLYVWQQVFLAPDFEVARIGGVTKFPLNLICTVAAATISFYLLERPLTEVGRRISKRRGAST